MELRFWRMEDLMKILLAIDDSQFSKEAVAAVRARPWPPGSTVRVLSAVQNVVPPAAKLWYDAGGSLDQVRRQIGERAEDLTSMVADSLRTSGLTAEPAVRQGDPRSVIVDEAEDWSADLIIVGSRGQTGITRWLLGSVAQSVVTHAPCSVEVVRQKQVRED